MNKSEKSESLSNLAALGKAESPKKSNLSFTFNIDIKNVMSDESSDSENADLQIDIAEIDNYEPTQKRLRIEVDETSALNEMEEEIERQLDAKAAKTNLTATNVKNILRHVITNEHVMAMVQNRLQNTDDKVIFEPKLTRAKAKELAMMQPNMRWPMTPVKKTSSSEVQELIEKDLSEDSSDEEYSPDQDQQSDDETEGDNLTNSDIDSQPSTPANLEGAPQMPEQVLTEIHYDSDGVFKIPEVPHGPTEVESIGQRTRSKLSLSETPLEQIEQAFIPPDITIDMYDWDCGKDPDWDNFLKEFTQPLGHDAANEDDPEADPEYNILEDKETDLLDKEELRMDKAVKVTKKELNDLVAELFEFEDMFSKNQVESPKKKNTSDNSLTTVQNMPTNNCMVDLLPALAEPELPKLVSPGQINLLTTQLRQHVQLMTQHFGMMYMHPEFHSYAKQCKENLNSLSYLTDGLSSIFNVENLPDALDFVNAWEKKFEDDNFTLEYTKFTTDESRSDIYHGNWGHKYMPKFHPELANLFVESKAFMYPHLLPIMQFRSYLVNTSRAVYLKSEDFLIALGLEQFTPFVKEKESKFNNKMMQLMDVAQMIVKYIMPCRTPRAIMKHIVAIRASKKSNPIYHYFKTGSAPRTIHCITLDSDLVAPKDQPRQLLPPMWQRFIEREYATKSWRKKTARLTKKTKDLITSASNVIVDESYRNPVVNMLPNVSHNNTPLKMNDDKVVETTEGNVAAMSNEGTSQTTKSPQLRKTTPRLAKIRSAQNMKLMTQVTGSKGLSNCVKLKSRGKSESSKDSEESCGSSKGDNEDEIAELMLASTTIKKDSATRKKAKQTRELENIKRLLNAESESAQEERAAKFAESYLQKLHVTLESSSPETVRAVFRIFTEYNEKVENINKMRYNDAGRLTGNHQLSIQTKEGKEKTRKAKDFLAINLYKDVCNVLHDYPELRTDFLLFLNPHQASMIDESTQHTMLQKMSEFMNVVQIYFAKQPSRLTKIMKAITQLTSNRYVTMADVHAAMDPILRGHQLVMDMFLQVLPMGKPPDSLFAMNLFENLTCPMGPCDKHKVYTEDSPELYENIEIPPPSQEDSYGGDNCKCDCHDSPDSGLKSVTAHCVSCGTRFLNGKIYLQTSEGLRPAKITFPGDDEEQLENISRISLKTTERFVPGLPATRRRKSSKNEPSSEESNQKQCTAKTSPNKDNDDGDRSTLKSKRGAKSPPKTADQRKLSKANEISSNPGPSSAGGSAEPTSPLKSKRETRAERREAKLELRNTGMVESSQTNEESCSSKSEQWNDSGGRSVRSNPCSSDSDMNITCESIDVLINKSDSVSMESKESINLKPWTRHEDMILLQNIKKNYSESTFAAVSEMLGDRTVEQVEERCQTLLSLLEKMV